MLDGLPASPWIHDSRRGPSNLQKGQTQSSHFPFSVPHYYITDSRRLSFANFKELRTSGRRTVPSYRPSSSPPSARPSFKIRPPVHQSPSVRRSANPQCPSSQDCRALERGNVKQCPYVRSGSSSKTKFSISYRRPPHGIE